MSNLVVPPMPFGPIGEPCIQFPGLTLRDGDLLKISGENGSGKTTLLRALFNNLATASPSRAILLPQNYTSLLYPYKPIWWNVALPALLGNGGRSVSSLKSEAGDALNRFNVEIDTAKYPHQLSGGEQHIVVLSRFCLASQSILMLDEPTTGLDRQNVHRFWLVLKDLVAKLKHVILVTHDSSVPTETVHSISITGVHSKRIDAQLERFV